MKLYKVNDLQGCGFMSDTHTEPMTANGLRSRFWSLEESRTEHYKDFTLAYIEDVWQVELEEAKTTYKLIDTNGEIVEWTIPQILAEVNRDRSEEWTDYNETDWREGLSLTDYKLV
jgi:hypothetical protein